MENFKNYITNIWKSPNVKYIFPYFLLIATFIIAMVLTEGSIKDRFENSFTWMIKFGGPLCLFAVGASLVLATGGVDISSSGVATFSGILMAIFLNIFSTSFYLGSIEIKLGLVIGLPIIILFAYLSGFLLGTAVTKSSSPSLVFSWTLGIIWLAASIYVSSSSKVFHNMTADVSGISVDNLSLPNERGIYILIVILALCQIIWYTGLPRKACAIGANRDSAVYAGISVNKTTIKCYEWSAIFSSLAGILILYQTGKASTSSLAGKEIICIAIAVLGGTVMSGGYLNIFSVAVAAFFYSNFQKITDGINIPNIRNQQQLIDTIFALIFIMVIVFFGKKINGITNSIQIERKTKIQ